MDPSQPRSEGQDQQFSGSEFLSPYANRRGSEPIQQNVNPAPEWTPPPYGDLERRPSSEEVAKKGRPISVYLEGPYRYATLIIPAFGGMVLMLLLGIPSPIGLGASYYTGLVVTNKKLSPAQKRKRYFITAAVVALVMIYSWVFGSKSVMG